MPNLTTALAGALLCLCPLRAGASDTAADWPTSIAWGEGYGLHTKGLFQFDTNTFSGMTSDPTSGTAVLADATSWRRKELGANLTTPVGIEAAFAYDFQIHQWLDNYFRYRSARLGAVRVGQFKTPVGWEDAQSSSATTFLERSLPVQAIGMGRRIGVEWTYPGIPHWLIALGYYHGGDLAGDNDGNTPAARIVFHPLDDSGNLVHLGIAIARETRTATRDGRGILKPPSARFRARPEANLTGTRIVDSGPLAQTGNIDRVGLEGAWIHGPLLLQGEYLRADAPFSDGRTRFRGSGYYLEAAWLLTGESRRYATGLIGSVQPQHRHGAFEIAARYSTIDLDDAPVFGGRQRNWTLGANWYLGEHWKLQANYIRAFATRQSANADARLSIDPKIVEVRAQLHF